MLYTRCYCELVTNVVYDNFQDMLVPLGAMYSALGNKKFLKNISIHFNCSFKQLKQQTSGHNKVSLLAVNTCTLTTLFQILCFNRYTQFSGISLCASSQQFATPTFDQTIDNNKPGFQPSRVPVSDRGQDVPPPRTECPPGHLALGHVDSAECPIRRVYKFQKMAVCSHFLVYTYIRSVEIRH